MNKTSKRDPYGVSVHERKNSNGIYHWEIYQGKVGGKPVREYRKTEDEALEYAKEIRKQKKLRGLEAVRIPQKLRTEAQECDPPTSGSQCEPDQGHRLLHQARLPGGRKKDVQGSDGRGARSQAAF